MNTLEDAKKLLRENWEKGLECPCCKQFVKLYHRALTSSMAYGLILIYRYFRNHPEEQWLHIEDHFKKLDIPSSIRGDVAKLRYFGLITARTGEREDGSKRNGYYSISELGAEFVKGLRKVPSHVRMYNQKTYGFTGSHIDIHEALGQKFNYRDLMGECYKDTAESQLPLV